MVTRWEIRVGDVRDRLREIPDESVQCVVTSPPYWGLRDYGTGTWVGGDGGCEHTVVRRGHGADERQARNLGSSRDRIVGRQCVRCGAVRQDDQLGLEPTPEEYVAKMVEVFREVRRVLRSDGTLWLNMGDCYFSSGAGVKPKDLVGMPWRLAFALQADGWWLRSDIIWAKPNPMPESVTDRPTKAHEYVFLLTKSERYFYDSVAVREASVSDHPSGNGYKRPEQLSRGGRGADEPWAVTPHRNLRTVWEIATEPYPEAHFATFPTKLVLPCIKAGTSEKGCCPECGAPLERVTVRRLCGDGSHRRRRASVDDDRNKSGQAWKEADQGSYHYTTTGWRPTCEHDSEPVPCTVLDPFSGAGTTGFVATQLGRSYIGIELSEEYAEMSRRRIMASARTLPEDGWQPTHDDLPLFR